MEGWIRGEKNGGKLEESKTSGTCPFNVSTHLICRDPRTTNTMMSSAKNGNTTNTTNNNGRICVVYALDESFTFFFFGIPPAIEYIGKIDPLRERERERGTVVVVLVS
eukprot:scaffold766_cov57-Cylindrotheca_fusiformis.AAC.1